MRVLISRILAAGALAVLSTAATAADLPYRGSIKDGPHVAPFSWSGFYMGLNAGFAWADSDVASSVAEGTYFFPSSVPSVNSSGAGSVTSSGFTGGAQAGYNFQRGGFVWGIETDIQSFRMDGRRNVGPVVYPCCPGNAYTIAQRVDTDWLFTLRGRAGFALGRTLLYFTGGWAVTDLETSVVFADPATTTTVSKSNTRSGWTIGGGAEYAVNNNWTVKAEYLYLDFGSVNGNGRIVFAPVPAFNAPLAHAADLTAHLARVGMNYKF